MNIQYFRNHNPICSFRLSEVVSNLPAHDEFSHAMRGLQSSCTICCDGDQCNSFNNPITTSDIFIRV